MASYYSQNSYYPRVPPHLNSYYTGLVSQRLGAAYSDLEHSGTDLLGSLSGGGDSGMGGSGSCFSLDICPDLILALIAAAAAGGFYFLYITITMAGRKRKRKRSLCEPQTESVGQILSDILNLGEVGYRIQLPFRFLVQYGRNLLMINEYLYEEKVKMLLLRTDS